MSSSGAGLQRRLSAPGDEPNNNNNNNNNHEDARPAVKSLGGGGQRPLTRKRSSVQSNLSSLANGSGHGSLHSSGSGSGSCSASTATSADDLEQAAAAGDKPAAASTSSGADYEHIRNTTLLFFLDRLYLASQEGKEARTLHDLSCLFGTKEFTKDMRQLVGASRNGLKKFLQSYPSLFQLEGDKVHLTQLKPGAAGAPQRDYNQEAVDYFKLKLSQFGTSLVPVKNLFGYRSQASQEVRHVSGKNARDFKRFLRQNESVFEILADEHVVLRSALAELESQGQSSLALEQSLQPLEPDEAVVTDPYLSKQFARQVEECVRAMRQEELAAGRLEAEARDEFWVTLEQLHERIKRHCQNELFLRMARGCDDLKVFLRMHPKLFKRFTCDQGRDCVRLLSERERQELEAAAQAHHSLQLQRQHSSLAGVGGEPAAAPAGQQAPSATSQAPLSGAGQSKPAAATSQRAPLSRSLSNQNGSPIARNQQQQQQQLRAAAPPFVPSKPGRQSSSLAAGGRSNGAPPSQMQQQQQQQQQPAMAPRSRSNVTTARSAQSSQAAGQQISNNFQEAARNPRGLQNAPPVDQRRAIRNYLMRGNAQPAGHNNMNWSAGAPPPSPHYQAHTGAPPAPPPPLSESELRARTVDIVREASNIITRIMTTADAVAFDCKGYNLGFDGQITLIQFGYLPTRCADPMRALASNSANNNNNNNHEEEPARAKPEVCVFDLITNPELAYCLKPLLESDKIVKIVHDVRNKSNALHVQFKIILNNVFDTQVANLVIQQQETGKPAYKSRYISMSKLCEIYGDEELLKYRNIIKYKTRHAADQPAASASSSNANSISNSNSNSNSNSSRSSKDVNYWRARPLTKPMIFEATMDVYCLVGGIYQNLKARLKPEYEPLFSQLNLEGVLARIKPEEIRSAKKERKIDLEVIDLKRKLYSETTGPVVLSNREIRLLRHIDLTPEVRQKIQQCRKVAKKLERLDMKAAQLRGEQVGLGQQQQQQVDCEGLESLTTSNSQLSSMAAGESLAAVEGGAGSLACAASGLNGEQQQQQRDGGASFAAKLDEFQATGVMSNLMDSSMFDELKDKMIESSSLLESLEDDDDDAGALSGAGAQAATCGQPHSSGSHAHGSHNGSLNHDCCGCQCHRSSSASDRDSAPSLGASLSSNASDGVEQLSKAAVEQGGTAEAATATDETTATTTTSTSTTTTTTSAAGPKDSEEPTAKAAEATAAATTTTGEQSGPTRDEQTADEAESKSSLGCDMAVQCDLLS